MSVVSSSSLIIKCDDICEIKKYLTTDKKASSIAVALFDFDDTYVMTGHPTANHLGGLQWRDRIRKSIDVLKKEQQISPDAPLFEYLTLFIAKSLKVNAVQHSQTAKLVEELEKTSHVRVMIFTARGSNGKNAWYKLNIKGVDRLTEQQMHHAGIQMSTASELPKHANVYKNQFIFCQNNPKEDILTDLFEKKVLDPSQISQLLFVDDKGDALPKIKKVAEAHNIPSFVGLHYTAVERMEQNEFDLLRSTIQLINLFALGHFSSQEAVETRAKEIKTSLTDEDFVKVSLKHIHQFFNENHLYRSYEDHDEFYRVIEAARVNFKLFRPA